MGTIIGVLIVGVIIYFVVKHLMEEAKYKFDKTKNSLLGERGYCLNCKYCLRDDARQYGNSTYFCRLSKCDDIEADTIMDCVEKPTVTEEDLQELYKLGIWNEAGKRYLREQLLGKKMGWKDIDEYLSKLPSVYPEYINRTQ